MTDNLRAQVEAAGPWYHRIELPGGVVTPGWAPLNAQAYRLPDDLTGARVLDVGAWDGYWTIEALRRGAAHVLAIDDFSDSDHGIVSGEPRPPDWRTFDLAVAAAGFGGDRVTRRTQSLYDLHPACDGPFDCIFFFGTLYHCRHPLLALDVLTSVAAPQALLLVETAICDDYSPYRAKVDEDGQIIDGGGYGSAAPVCEFYAQDQYGERVFILDASCIVAPWLRIDDSRNLVPTRRVWDLIDAYSNAAMQSFATVARVLLHELHVTNPTNWWVPNSQALGQMLRAAGWLEVQVQRLQRPEGAPLHPSWLRGFAQAWRVG